MNTRTPLAMAFLMAASTALAQPYAATGAPGSFGTVGSGTYGITLCTPGDTSCMKDYMTSPNAGLQGVQDMGSRVTLRPGQEWASPDCQRIPCNTVASAKMAADQKSLEQRMADQRKMTPDRTVVDMGDGKSFGIIDSDMMISIDNGSSCGIPRKMTDAEQSKFSAQIENKKMEMAGNDQIKRSLNPGMPNNSPVPTGNKGAPNTRGPGAFSMNSERNPAADSQDSSGSRTTNEDGDGTAAGRDIGAIQASMNDESTGSSNSAPASGSNGAGNEVGPDKQSIKIAGSIAAAQAAKLNGYSFINVRKAADASDRILKGSDLNDRGGDSKRVSVDSTFDPKTHTGDPKADFNSAPAQ